MSRELNVTAIIERYSGAFGQPGSPIGSIATMGMDAAQITFDNACRSCDVIPDDVTRGEMIAHFRGYGAWSDAELHQMTTEELRAMLLQDILLTHMDDEQGTADDDGAVWFYMGG